MGFCSLKRSANSSSGRSIQAQHSTQSGHVVNGVIYRRRARKFLRAAVMGLLPEALSPPRTKTPIVPNDGDVAPNDEVSFAPRDCQLHHHVSVYDLWYRAAFVPSTKTSRRPAFYQQAAGPVPAATCPPRECQLDHAVPLQSLYQTAPSVPRAKTSIRPLPSEVAAGDEVRDPPREVQLDHEPVHVF
jgi:hypothetical protein